MDKRNIISKLFPVQYDFYGMITNQAKINWLAVSALDSWLGSGSEGDSKALLEYAQSADQARMALEKNLIEAFTTPFDRTDIYSISAGMDRVIGYVKSTLLSMKAFQIPPDATIRNMVNKLREGTEAFFQSAQSLKNSPDKSEENFRRMRATHFAIERFYIDGMTAVFQSNDPMGALKQREVYHHLKDASQNLEDAVDILHRIVVRLT